MIKTLCHYLLSVCLACLPSFEKTKTGCIVMSCNKMKTEKAFFLSCAFFFHYFIIKFVTIAVSNKGIVQMQFQISASLLKGSSFASIV